MSHSTELAVHGGTEDVFALGKAMHASGLFPDVKRAEQAVVKILAGREFGIGPVAALSGIHIIDGKPSAGSGLLAGLVKASGKYDYDVLKLDATGCELEFFDVRGGTRGTRVTMSRDKNGKPAPGTPSVSFGPKEAKDANLIGRANYKKHPLDMFFARAVTAGVRRFCPDVINGLVAYTPDELGAAVDEDGNVLPAVVEAVKPARTKAVEPAANAAAPVADVEGSAVEVVTDPVTERFVPDRVELMRAFKASGWTPDKLRWKLVEIGIESVEDLKAAIAGLSLDQACGLQDALVAAAATDDGVPGSGEASA